MNLEHERLNGVADRTRNCIPALAQDGPINLVVGAPFDAHLRNLLTFATYSVVPVHERPVRIVPPSPDMQLEKRGQSVPIRAVHELE
jgi:hypothetical protein